VAGKAAGAGSAWACAFITKAASAATAMTSTAEITRRIRTR
jgi:hypothetical protein